MGFFASSGILNRRGFFGGKPFSPLDISGLQLWLDATTGLFDATSGGSAVTTDGSAVARWEDQSGNGRHATQGTSNNRPVLKTAVKNSKNVIRLDGSNDSFSFSSIVTTDQTPIWVFVVNYFDVTTSFKNTLNVNQFAYFYFDSTGTKIGIGRDGVSDEILVNHTATTWAILGGFTEKTGANTTSKIRINSVESSATKTGSGGSVLNGVSIKSGSHFDGDIAEIIVYNSSLTASNLSSIETYLNSKWAIY